ncbi:MAG: redoxin domain-containing protein [Pirellulales bacterium]
MLLAAICCAAVHADQPAERDSAAPRVTSFKLKDARGKEHSADDWRTSKAVVLFFLGTECPVSNGYSPLMQRIAKSYARRGVRCYGIHCDPSVSADEAGQHAQEYGLEFDVLLDPEQTLVRMTGVRIMPEVVVATPDGKLLYRGRIDDKYALDGKRRDEPTTHELVDALEAVLAGRTPAIRETKVFGCPLPKPAAVASPR